jgi:hypothetical protein
MRRFLAFVLLWALSTWPILGAEYRLTNGDIIKGEPASATDDGMVVRLDFGGFSPRIGWGKLTQESLKELQNNPITKKFVEPFIEQPIEEKVKERAKKKEIVLKEVPRVDHPAASSGFVPSLFKVPGLIVLILFYLANLYAAYAVAAYKQRPRALACALSAILPVIGPILILTMPDAEPVPGAEPAPGGPPPTPPAGAPANAAAAGAGSGLGLAAHGKKAETVQQVYRRGEVNFDRRFFETKFSGFFRVVPAEAEKDLVLAVKTSKGEFVAKRISRISMSEVHLMLLRGGAETPVPLGEVIEVQVRHKDAK